MSQYEANETTKRQLRWLTSVLQPCVKATQRHCSLTSWEQRSNRSLCRPPARMLLTHSAHAHERRAPATDTVAACRERRLGKRQQSVKSVSHDCLTATIVIQRYST